MQQSQYATIEDNYVDGMFARPVFGLQNNYPNPPPGGLVAMYYFSKPKYMHTTRFTVATWRSKIKTMEYLPIWFEFCGFDAGILFGGMPSELYYFTDREDDVIEFEHCLN